MAPDFDPICEGAKIHWYFVICNMSDEVGVLIKVRSACGRN